MHDRISYGWVARRNSLPWMAYILIVEEEEMSCAGFLVDNGSGNQSDIVITATHCIASRTENLAPSRLHVILGAHEMRDIEPAMVYRRVKNYATHFYNYDNDDNDITLLKLSSPVNYTEEISPICLPTKHTTNRLLDKCFAAGWGKTESRLAFQGDSGSPLFCEIDGRYFALGVLSLGPANCSEEEEPFGFYVRMDNYHEWILDTMKQIETVPDRSDHNVTAIMASVTRRLATKPNTPKSPYDTMVTAHLNSAAFSVQWLPENRYSSSSRSNSSGRLVRRRLLVGSLDGVLNLCEAKVPGRNYNEQYSSSGPFRIVKAVSAGSEITRARYMPQRPEVVAMKCQRPEVFVFNLGLLRSYERHEQVVVKKVDSLNHLKLKGHFSEGFGLSWNERRTGYLLSGSRDGVVCLWDVNRTARRNSVCSTISEWIEIGAPVNDVCWNSMSPTVFAYVNDEGLLTFEDIRTKITSPVSVVTACHGGKVSSVACNPTNSYFVLTGASYGEIKLWDTRKLQEEVHWIDLGRRDIYTLAWCPAKEGVLAAGDTDAEVTIYDVKMCCIRQNVTDEFGIHEKLFTHRVHTGEISDISWDKDIPWMMASLVIGVRPCGVPAISPLKVPTNKNFSRISFGWEARPNSLPWMVHILAYENRTRFTCSGFLIDSGLVNQSDIVVTAAHCVHYGNTYMSPRSFLIFLGAHDLNKREQSIIYRDVRNYVTHFYSDQKHDNDIVLLRLKLPVRYTKEISPVCLATKHTVNTNLDTCFAAGWGATEAGSASAALKQTRIRIVPISQCFFKERDARILCVRDYYRRSFPCRGDSGSPLFCEIDGRYFAVGVLSLGPANCSSEPDPVGFYVRMDNYHDWAIKTMEQLRGAPDQSKTLSDGVKIRFDQKVIVPGLLSLVPAKEKTKSLSAVDLMAVMSNYHKRSIA
ncbi:WD40 and Trypsin domain containing protein [Trichuris trichiura]|uniref:WD40 and Trypsin domain containing protein n=1 Tax=Trichuris trichiura TaxID=36087 RepID=A0A077ZF48_TRITR|nr:WD40 and Trypsin domain containing protein [Trichuris trichiura]